MKGLLLFLGGVLKKEIDAIQKILTLLTRYLLLFVSKTQKEKKNFFTTLGRTAIKCYC